ncbi:MAG: hypothetical protein WKG07_31070 [Hymenobacter sp.]
MSRWHRYKASTEAQLINSLSSVSGKVSQLAANQTYFNNPNRLPIELKQLRALTKADVQRVYDKYIRGKHAVILSVVPKGKTDEDSRQATITPPPRPATWPPTTATTSLKYVKATDTFDRAKQPGAGANPVVKVPRYLGGQTRQRPPAHRHQEHRVADRDHAAHHQGRAPAGAG